VPRIWDESVATHKQRLRATIIDATVDLVRDRGRGDVSMSAVAAAAGIGRATLYNYFPDVDHILAAFVVDEFDRHFAHLDAELADTAGPLARLQVVVGVTVEYLASPRHQAGSSIVGLDAPLVPVLDPRLLLDELDQRAEAAFGVDERDGRPPAAGPWCLVDGRGARVHHRRQRRRAVLDAVADVVEALAPLLDRLRHRAVGPGRRQELDVGVGHLQQRLLDPVPFHDLAVVDRGAIQPILSSCVPLDQVGEAALQVHHNLHEGKVGVLCLAPARDLGIDDPEKRARIGEDRIRRFERGA